MILDYSTIIQKIVDSAGLERKDVEEKINQKLREMQDLITKEGAAHIIANELNVRLFDSTEKNLKISQIRPGLNSVNIIGKVIKVFEIREFNKNNRKGRIGSLLVGDETGTARIVIWDEKIIDLTKEISEGDIIKVSNTYIKQNNNFQEVHLGNRAQLLINPENETVEDVKITVVSTSPRKKIEQLQPGEFAEIIATIVQVFEPRYYNACPVCNKKVMPEGEYYVCGEHKRVPAKQVPILNAYLDDGTGAIRAVFFGENASKVMNSKTMIEDIKKEALGKYIVVKGKVNKNDMFGRIEFAVNSFNEADPEKLVEEIEMA